MKGIDFMNIALVGNQNSGKTTLFNFLTGMNAKVGNWPGVTVDYKVGMIKETRHELVDLPGIYSLFPYTLEESVSSEYILSDKPDLLINVVDVTSVERGLYLTSQLLELNVKTVVVLNMMEDFNRSGKFIDIYKLKSYLKTDVVVFSPTNSFYNEIINIINSVSKICRSNFVSNRKFEISEFEDDIVKRYRLVDDICFDCLTFKKLKRNYTDVLDKLFLNKYLAFPFFVVVMFLIYYISVGVVGGLVSNFISNEIDVFKDGICNWLFDINVKEWIISLICDGIIPGVATVISFVPQLFVLFFSISVLESSGYMSRIAVILDFVFKKIGLSGKALIPFIIGLGCSVPGILGAKILENDNERKITTVLTPFIPCSAKLPIIALFSGYFFGDKAGFVSASLYFLSICIVVFCGYLLNRFVYKNNTSVFISELPKYRFPNFKYVFRDVFEKVSSFIKRATSVILICSVVVWFLISFSVELEYGVEIENSILGKFGKGISWFFYPMLGVNSWEASVCAIQGLIAKEQVVSSMAIVSGASDNMFGVNSVFGFFTKSSAYAFVVFNLFSAPCFSAIYAMKTGLGSFKRMFKAVFFQTLLSWVLGIIVYNFGVLIEGGKFNVFNLIIVFALFLYILLKTLNITCLKKCENCPYDK